MSASIDTVEKILDVVLKHVEPDVMRKIVDDLLDVPGNLSFRETVERLRDRAAIRSTSLRYKDGDRIILTTDENSYVGSVVVATKGGAVMVELDDRPGGTYTLHQDDRRLRPVSR